jgi:hypothetical protein
LSQSLDFDHLLQPALASKELFDDGKDGFQAFLEGKNLQ